MAHGKQHGIGGYVAVALILGVITFIEFAIVEWPPTFMSSGWVLFWLIALSIVKFWMVIWFFMHLKDDDRLYTGFFSSGMVIAMGTFVALVFMFLLPRAVAPILATDAPAGPVDAHGSPYAAALPEAVVANIATDGASRPLAERARAPRPADRSLVVTPPAAAVDGFEVRLDVLNGVVATEAGDLIAAEAAVSAAEGPDPEFDRALGVQVYASCRGCHQPTGAGIPGVFPPLAGHAAELLQSQGGIGGRAYLIDVILYGLQGPIVVDGVTYNGVMPAWPNLGDEQVAAVVNHIVAGFDGVAPPEDFDAIRTDEVAAQRGRGLSGADVHALRAGLAEAPADAAPAPAEPAAAPAAEPAAPEPAPAPTAADPIVEPAVADPTFDRDAAAQLYTANCAACHQPTGAGLPGVFPPLAGHTADLYAVEGGRDYLIDVMLYGLQGPITANGVPYNSLMPAWPQLGDAQIALLINHSVAGFAGVDVHPGFDAIRAEEVEARRGQGINAAQVLERRRALGLE
jgi:mono/diheme cytochrome c family protein